MRTPTTVCLVGTGITLPSVGDSARRYCLATAYLDAALGAHPPLRSRVTTTRVDVEVDLGARSFADEVVQAIADRAPSVLGLSCYCWDLEAQLHLARAVRTTSPSTTIVAGGPSVSYDAVRLLEREPALDAVVVGEGEGALCRLVERVASGERIHSEVIEGGPTDLGAAASPLLAGVLRPPSQNLMLELSRGCVHRCTYCAWKLSGGGVRYATRARIEAELAWALEGGYEHAFVIDSAVNDSAAHLDNIVGSVAASDPHRQLALSYFVSLEALTAEQARKLERLRSHEITVGLESLNPAAIKAAGRKRVEPDEVARKVALLAEQVAPPTVSIMLGMPGDDLAGFRRTVDFLARLGERGLVRSVRVHWMLIAPGSYLWTRADRYGLIVAPSAVPYVLGSDTLPTEDLLEALRFVRRHDRSDLFVWEDEEPLQLLDGSETMFAAGGEHLGGRSARTIASEEALSILRPLRPGAPLPGGFTVGEISREGGFPVINLSGPDRSAVRLQVRPRGAEPTPYRRTPSYDLVLLPGTSGGTEERLTEVLLRIIEKNDQG